MCCYVVDHVTGVTQLHDVVYVVCGRSSKISRFNATTHERLTDINVNDLRWPRDIAACEQTSHVYVADYMECVWRVSSDGADMKHWLPKSPSDTMRPSALSVTSSRLLVTSRDNKQLIQFDAAGVELRRVLLPDYMKPGHAVESPTGTFIVCHCNDELNQFQVNEVDAEGQVLRQFSGSRLVLTYWYPPHIAVDSRGNIFVADSSSRRILLLDAQLALRRIIIDEHQLNDKEPLQLCYNEQSGQLLVSFDDSVAVFDAGPAPGFCR